MFWRWSFFVCLACSCLSARAQESKCSAYLKPRFLSSTSESKLSAQYKKSTPAGSTLRFVLPVLNDAKLLVYEPPNPEHDALNPDTHLVLLRGGVVTKRISFHQLGIRKEYRVVSAARLCAGDNALLYLASGAGATGVSEFFVVLLFDETGVRAFKLPEANQGRLEIFESNPFNVKLWSASEEDMGFCGACPKHYYVSDFRLDQKFGFKKEGSRRTPGMIPPDPLIDRPLILHRASGPQKQAPSL